MSFEIATAEEKASQKHSSLEIIENYNLFQLSRSFWRKFFHNYNITHNKFSNPPEFIDMKTVLKFQQECGALLAGSSMLTYIFKSHLSNDTDYFITKENEDKFKRQFLPKFGPYKKRLNRYTISHKKFDLYEFYTKRNKDAVFNNKVQVVVVDTKLPLLDYIRQDFDITICTTCTDGKQIFYSKDGPLKFVNKESSINLDVILSSKNTLRITLGRIEKYQIDKGIKIDWKDLEEEIKNKCHICLNPFDYNNISSLSCCKKLICCYCITKISRVYRGDIIYKKNISCPFCRAFLSKEYVQHVDYSKLDFENNIYFKCEKCAKPELLCSKICVEDHVDDLPSEDHQPESRIQKLLRESKRKCQKCKNHVVRIIKCKNTACNIQMIHNGGCSEFRCCILGIHECKRIPDCDHGSYGGAKCCGTTFSLTTDEMNIYYSDND